MESTRRRALARRYLLAVLLATASFLLPAALNPQLAHAEEGVHVVSPGENLGLIAQQYGVSARDLAANNGIVNPNIVRVGQRLAIPGLVATDAAITQAEAALPGSSGYYTIARGDTLSQIAEQHGMSTADLMRLNGLSDPNFAWVGQQLRVSARVDAVAPDAEQVELAQADAIHVVQAGQTLSQIAEEYSTTTPMLLAANGLPSADFVWTGQRLRIQDAPQPAPVADPIPAVAASAIPDGRKWIEVDLTNQTLTAWQGETAVMHTSVSTGTPATPTVTGTFNISWKLDSQRMTGPGYDLPGVPWVMYFYQGYAIHGAYWHNNFGATMSHGCVNMRPGEAGILYEWAPEGTEVYVHY